MNLVLRRAAISSEASADVRRVASAHDDSMDEIRRAVARVSRSEIVAVTAPASADVPFIVLHTLGDTPKYFSAQTESSATCYATAADKLEWGADQITMRCTAANETLLVRVEV